MKSYHVLLDGTRLYRWNGGLDFLANLASICYGIQQQPTKMQLKVSVMLPYKIPEYEIWLRKLLGKALADRNETVNNAIETVRRTNPNVEVMYLRKYDMIKGSEDWAVRRLVVRNNVDCIIGVTSSVYRDLPIPWVSYIPDYQHKYLSQFFSEQECVDRDRLFSEIANIAPYFIATSESHKADMVKFSKISPEKIFTMPFAPITSDSFLDTSAIDLRKYNLPQNYFLISNQFWKHKSHETAAKALKILHNEGYTDVQIICTGKTEDYRNVEYANEINALVSRLQLQQHFRMVGLIPKLEQIEIMKKAVALIQPSLFEGDPGGCSTYDAVGLERPVILSDTPVNLEAKVYDKAHFFIKESAEDLARQMKAMLELEKCEYSQTDVLQKREKNKDELKNFFENMIIEICGGKK